MSLGAEGTSRSLPSGWRLVGESLVRELAFRDFDQALAFVERIGAAAADHFRRPDMCILEFNHVRLTVHNPHQAGITEAERRLVTRVDAAIEAWLVAARAASPSPSE